jgi:UDP-2,3-diacylglucosamine hydrolase
MAARLFVSDLHLDASATQAVELFLRFLRKEALSAEALYILGDLFEVWIGDDDRDADKTRVCDALRELTAAGVPCFILHGNRDFLYGHEFTARTGCIVLPDPVVASFDEQNILLTHGDALCVGDRSYQELRSIVRQPEWQQRFMRLARSTREKLAARARRGSRAHTSTASDYIMDVDARAVAAALRSTGTHIMIHGHTHRPATHELSVDGAPAKRIVLGAWHTCGNYLVVENGNYELRMLSFA